MRVLMLATTAPVEPGDGTPGFVIEGAMALGDDHDVTVVVPLTGDAPRRRELGKVTVLRFPYLPRRWRRLGGDAIVPQLRRSPLRWLEAVVMSLGMVAAAVRVHRSVRPDVVHAHWLLPGGVAALVLHRLFGTPYVVTAHGADAYALNTRPLVLLKRLVVVNAARFVAVSGDILDRFADVTEHGVVQPAGVDVARWERLVGERRPVAGRVVLVGRLERKKGARVAIDAVAALPDAELWLVGDGPERRALEEQVAVAGVTDRIRFLGRLPQDRVAEVLRTAACAIIPSIVAEGGDMDGTPSVLGEAIAGGVPVVASDLAGLAELLVDGRSGLLVPPGDAVALRAAVASVLADPTWAATMAEEARGVLDVLDLDRAAGRHRGWYAEAAADG